MNQIILSIANGAYDETFTLFFAMMGLLVGFVAVATLVLNVIDRKDQIGLLKHIKPFYIALATFAAVGSMIGSLFLSEVIGYKPCHLCWIQRYFMYPAAILLIIYLFTRIIVNKTGSKSWFTMHLNKLFYPVILLAMCGLPVSIYHRYIQAYQKTTTSCDPDNPCSWKYMEHFGFVTTPTIAGIAFFCIIVFLVLQLISDRQPISD